jgi:DUF971 family protein
MHPIKLEVSGADRLSITWSDGNRREYTFRELRDACPCATCRELRSAPPPNPMQLTVLKPAETQPLKITGMTPVGNYAYSIHFSDGHDTGIFTLELLRELGKPVAE